MDILIVGGCLPHTISAREAANTVSYHIVMQLAKELGWNVSFCVVNYNKVEWPAEAIIEKQVLENADKLLDGIVNGEGRGSYHPEYGEIYWEFEEFSFLQISEDLDRFYFELEKLIKRYLEECNLSYNEKELSEAVIYQKLRVPTCQNAEILIWDFEFNFPEYFERRLSNSKVVLCQASQRLSVKQPSFANREEYAREVILWGRKSGLIERAASWNSLNRSKVITAAE